ncbi:MAG: septum formation initiator family protein [Candidatus Komeilibacteria bacterium]|nr:septum formation initiator family protein [Candidatus Komeilibacteria bacterium]
MSQGNIKKFYYSKWFIIGALAVIVFFIFSTVRDYYRQQSLRDEIGDLSKQISQLSDQRQELEETWEYAQSEDFVEIEARTKLNLRKPGEKVIIVTDPEQAQQIMNQGARLQTLQAKEEESGYKVWWKYFFKT